MSDDKTPNIEINRNLYYAQSIRIEIPEDFSIADFGNIGNSDDGNFRYFNFEDDRFVYTLEINFRACEKGW